MPYDAKGAGLFTVVVIAVYCISIVLFIASFIKRKKGVTVEADENTVTQYLTQVADLKEKTAREHFKKLKMGIIEKVEKGVEKGKDEGKCAFSNRFKERRTKESAEVRQPLLENECTNCVSTKPTNNLDTCSKLVEALHSIKEVTYSKSSSESYPSTSGNQDTIISLDSPSTPEKCYKFVSLSTQSSEDSDISIPPRQSTNYHNYWYNNLQERMMKANEQYQQQLDDNVFDISDNLLLPLPPPPAFQQGYNRQVRTYQGSSPADTNETIVPGICETTSYVRCQSDEPLFRNLDSPSQFLPYSTFRGKHWPPSPSLGQAARARLAPKSSAKHSDDEWDQSAINTNGLFLKVLRPEIHRYNSSPSKPKETRVAIESTKNSAVSIL